MLTEATDSSPQHGAQPGGSCRECGAPHAKDQRYCLACGAPLAGSGATVAFAPVAGEHPSPPSSPPPHLLAGSPAGAPAGSPPQNQAFGAAGGHGASSAPTVIAGVGVLLLAMGVGVLIGRTGNSASPAAAVSPQVVTVTASTTTSSTEAGESATGSGSSGSAKHRRKSAASSKGVGSSIEKPAPPSVLTKLKESEKSGNGSKYEQESNHLPNVVSTG
jgi:hypothetical protein